MIVRPEVSERANIRLVGVQSARYVYLSREVFRVVCYGSDTSRLPILSALFLNDCDVFEHLNHLLREGSCCDIVRDYGAHDLLSMMRRKAEGGGFRQNIPIQNKDLQA